ncbi:VirB4 family type IV secretion/conjugal transfer ATPase [Brevundimonas abyssalis]|uniref:Type IV secretion system protein virB4 n=1 Tax=Brevundimonas abyssalis TAR-001 TaxID=1391729 RepID=A0A8E0NE10_9CAUL|nr:VirB4 family type IV secretion/conjugal transfer ATPase [Brevundimonas abyssalis]GAD60559.1 ATPase provides energy for both assembly of type IV secretion complex and secretion of T-DNA complex [Brevundimonas abyssalis TAR-001]
MLCLKLDGVSFETADVRDLNDWHVKLNQAWRNLADDRLALWHHVVRRPVRIPPTTGHRSQFARELADAYDARLARGRLFVNDLYLTLVLHPGRRPGDRAEGLLRRVRDRGKAVLIDDGPLRRLEDAARDLVQLLERYGPRRLALYEANGLWFSEPLEMIRLILTGRPGRVPLTCGHLGEAVYTMRAIFGRETLELRDVADARFAGILALKEYPSVTRPGLWDGLLDAPFPFVLSQSFAFLSKPAARAVLERKQNQMVSSRDRAASQIEGLDAALDDLVSNRFVMGEHHASLLVYGDDPAQLADHLSRARGLLAESGLVVAREDLGLEAAFWAQFPGVFGRRTRPAAVTSRNFAALAPFHTHPAGRPAGHHWGEALAVLRTTAASPFHLNLHVGDLGHTFICGPSGSGKTVVQNFLLAQMERFGAQQVFIDKDRGAEIFVRACGGDYLALKPGEPTGFAPFRALESTPANRAFLARLVRAIAARPDAPFTVGQLRAVDEAVLALEALPRSRRSLGALRALLGQGDAGGLGARLERWTADGPLGWVLDNPRDAVALNAPLAGFDVTTILDDPEVRAPVMLYLLHRIGQRVDGRRFVLDIDEFWKALGDPAFTDLIRDGLKTWRKQNALMMFGTQSPADALASPIAPAILEQCATKIFLPNAHGQARDYVDGFGLSRTEFRLIRDELTPESHRFLIKQGHTSVVAELDLSGLDEALAVLSGRAETTALLDRLRAEHGDDYAQWGPAFHRQRRPS